MFKRLHLITAVHMGLYENFELAQREAKVLSPVKCCRDTNLECIDRDASQPETQRKGPTLRYCIRDDDV